MNFHIKNKNKKLKLKYKFFCFKIEIWIDFKLKNGCILQDFF
jgi:hypothetical protein